MSDESLYIYSNTTPIPSQVHDVRMSSNLTLNVAMVESLPEVDLCCSSMIVQGVFFPKWYKFFSYT